MKLEVGKFYSTRGTDEVLGPIVEVFSPFQTDYKFGVSDSDGIVRRVWREDGRFLGSGEHQCDLVAEVDVFATDTAGAEALYDLAPEVDPLDDHGDFAVPNPDAADPEVKVHIANEAVRIVTGARRGAYGTPENNFERIARFWQAYFENTGRPEAKITAADVSPLMRLMKEARLCETPDHYDSHVDLVGYTLTGAEVAGVDIPV